MARFSFSEYDDDSGVVILQGPEFDFDSFAELGHQLVMLFGAEIKEKQRNADLHIWLIQFDDYQLLLKAEHYSQALWLECVVPKRLDDTGLARIKAHLS